MRNNKGFIELTLIEFIVALIVIFFVLLMFAAPFIHISSTGSGRHTGYITAIEQEGYFFPNYRVYVKTDNSSSQEDVYCMNREKSALAEKLKSYSQNRELVEVTFKGVRGIGLGLCYDVEIVEVEQVLK